MIVVAGGGAIGPSVAYYLCLGGAEVVLVSSVTTARQVVLSGSTARAAQRARRGAAVCR